MSMKSSRMDPIPNIRAAGKVIAMGGECADICIRADVHQKP